MAMRSTVAKALFEALCVPQLLLVDYDSSKHVAVAVLNLVVAEINCVNG